ncbi:hypothetical protein GCM10025868_26470 [Angustibacter aerolatus]|uniref:Uncharacterized protein n=1 Tax=Angustibacter aerolatus TaxID=1162965 RepID=A0ABQ6JI24_9ACTN|nr:hypothetical protein GCM10025868_26470 [Angustibacter aerolatus]
MKASLQAGDHVGQRRLRGQAGDDADDAGGREHAGAGCPGRGEGEQHRRDGQHGEHHDGEPAQEPHLGAHPPGLAVVLHVDVVAAQREVLEHERQGRHQPGDGADQRQAEHPGDHLDGAAAALRRQHALHRRQHHRHPQRTPGAVRQVAGHRAVAAEAAHQAAQHPGHEQRGEARAHGHRGQAGR